MNKIDCIIKTPTCYSLENYCTTQLSRALERAGLSVEKLVISGGGFADYIVRLHENPPDMTLSFRNIFPGEKPLCEGFQVPHLYWNLTFLSSSLHYLESPLATVAFYDQGPVRELQRAGYQNLFYLPNGVDPNLKTSPEEERPYDVILLEDLVDTTSLETMWEALFPREIVEKLHLVVNRCGQEYPLAATKEIFGERPEEISWNDLVFCAEEYLLAKKTLPLIHSFERGRIDVFGKHVGNNWLQRLPNREHIFLHWAPVYCEYFELFKRSKILVTDRASPWIFPAWACGCAVVHDTEVDTLLDHPKRRIERVRAEQERVLKEETWDRRVVELLERVCTLTS